MTGLGSARSKPGHDLDVGGVGEQVDERRAGVAVAGLGEEPGVAAERGRVAADEHDAVRRGWRRPPATPVRPRPVRGGSATTTSARGRAASWSTSARTTRAPASAEVVPGVGHRRAVALDQRRPAGRRRRVPANSPTPA